MEVVEGPVKLRRKRERGTCPEGRKREERRRCALEKREYALVSLPGGYLRSQSISREHSSVFQVCSFVASTDWLGPGGH